MESCHKIDLAGIEKPPLNKAVCSGKLQQSSSKMADHDDQDNQHSTFFGKVKADCILESIYDETGEVPQGWLSRRGEQIVEKGTGKKAETHHTFRLICCVDGC